MKSINLKQLSVDDLLTLRNRINAMLESRVDRERRELESRLKRLQHFKASAAERRNPASAATTAAKRARKKKLKANGKVAPKYRNPENPSETWAGRGLQPRWLRAALNDGKKIGDFQIAK